MKIIGSREELKALATELGVRLDWHEPDEQGVTAKMFGSSFDNAGNWASSDSLYTEYCEQHVVLYQNDYPVAKVNLATLFAWACGLES